MFLFMAATVVSVVFFLCGVLVGRGVRADRGTVAQAAALDEAPTPDVMPAVTAANTPVQAGADPTVAAPPPTVNDLSPFNRLETPTQTNEDLTPEVAKAVVTKPVQATSAAPPPATEVAGAAIDALAPPPPGDGYAVQVAAVNVRSDADAIAKRLTSKGYAAYVQEPPNGTGTIFRVRVGTFKTRREADAVAAKLQKEEQFKPWVTR